MASYPFPRPSSFNQPFPQTPKEQEEERHLSPPLEMPRQRDAKDRGARHLTAIIVIALVLFLYLLYPSSRPGRQTDRMPFSRDSVEE